MAIYRLRDYWIRLFQWLASLAYSKPLVAAPELAKRCQQIGIHVFTVKLDWIEDDQTYLVTCPELPGLMTDADNLPEALYMFGDAAKMALEHDLCYGFYPPKQDNVIRASFDAKETKTGD